MRKPNIAIIVLDTMRLDEFKRLEAKYGEFKKLGFSFIENCIAPSSWTLPSHASLLTGMYPKEHGAHETKSAKTLDIDAVKLRVRTMVSDLSDAGYKTYCISANPYLNPVYGFDEFDSFKEESYFTDIFGSAIEIPERMKPLIAKYRDKYGNKFFKIGFAMLRDDPMLITEMIYLPQTGVLTIKSLAKKLKAKLIEGWPIEKGGKFIVETVKKTKFKGPYFLLINFMEAHDPYVGKKGQDFNWATAFMRSKPSQELRNKWKRLYSVGATKAYRYAVQVLTELRDRFGDNQLFIVTSDHGQAFGEHGFICHGTMLFDELVRVPMVIKLPNREKLLVKKDFSSLVNVRGFISAELESPGKASDKLYSREVYAQSFGIPANISIVSGIDKAKLKAYDKPINRTFKSR